MSPAINAPASDAAAAVVAYLVLAGLALSILFFSIRPDLWRRLWFERVDPRPAAIMRIAFGATVFGTFAAFAFRSRLLFTDEGFYLPALSRATYGGALAYLWDPAEGFERWWTPWQAIFSGGSILHLRSEPPLVFALVALALASVALMTAGAWTRPATVASWILIEQLYRYDALFYTSGDFVLRNFLFLAMFVRWGEAYSIDAARRRRHEILGSARRIPPLRHIPAWPLRLMALQLACIYLASGLGKSSSAWRDGVALYYALNLDALYRVPLQGPLTWLQYVGVLPLLTWITRWWELLFPAVLVGQALRAHEERRRAGLADEVRLVRRAISWAVAAAVWAIAVAVAATASGRAAPALLVAVLPPAALALYRAVGRRPRALALLLDWVLGKRLWLAFGLALHAGIDLSLNIGTFPQLMVAVYPCLLSGRDIDAFWTALVSRPLRPGEGARPVRRGLAALVLAPLDRVRYRATGPTHIVHCAGDEHSIRRAALLRPWDLGSRLAFAVDAVPGPRRLQVDVSQGGERVRGAAAGAALAQVLPGLWWLRPLTAVRPLRGPAGRIALRLLGQS